jgi:NADH-quinone oxidoreductase subunit N
MSLKLDQMVGNLFFDCSAFFPELIVCFTIVFLLILRLMRTFHPVHLGWVALPFTLLALAAAGCQWNDVEPFQSPESIGPRYQEIFSGLLVYDNFTIFLRLLLLAFAALVIWLTMLTGIPDREDSADFYSLLLGATLGMCIMASANHLLMVFLGVEMASVPSYALAGFLKGKRQGSEASLKYVVYGGGASGIMLYGISLLAGKFGTAYLPNLATGYIAALKETGGFDVVLLLGTLFILIGLCFKLAAVPFHFWCPDVFEGAAAEVAAFLSVASKGAALALVGRLALVLAGLTDWPLKRPELSDSWMEVARYFIPALAFLAAVTATFGNLAAFAQTNLKRLLAYSTIAHAGYMMMGLATLNPEGASAVLLYLVAYLVMNLGAFAVVAFLRNQTGSEDLSSYKGMVSRSPLMTVLLAIFLLSLLGLPPLAGFAAKFQVFSVLFNSGNYYVAEHHPELGYLMYALLVIGGINSVISAVYYLKVLKVMILDTAEEPDESRPVNVPGGSALYGTILALMIFVVFLAWQHLGKASDDGVNRFQPVLPTSAATAEVKP